MKLFICYIFQIIKVHKLIQIKNLKLKQPTTKLEGSSLPKTYVFQRCFK